MGHSTEECELSPKGRWSVRGRRRARQAAPGRAAIALRRRPPSERTAGFGEGDDTGARRADAGSRCRPGRIRRGASGPGAVSGAPGSRGGPGPGYGGGGGRCEQAIYARFSTDRQDVREPGGPAPPVRAACSRSRLVRRGRLHRRRDERSHAEPLRPPRAARLRPASKSRQPWLTTCPAFPATWATRGTCCSPRPRGSASSCSMSPAGSTPRTRAQKLAFGASALVNEMQRE